MHGRAFLAAEGLGMPVLPMGPEANGFLLPAQGFAALAAASFPTPALHRGARLHSWRAPSSLCLQNSSRHEQKCICCSFSLQSHPSRPRLRTHGPASPSKTHPSCEGPKGEPVPPRGARAAPTQGCPLPSRLRAALEGSVPVPRAGPGAGCSPARAARRVAPTCCSPKGMPRLPGFRGGEVGGPEHRQHRWVQGGCSRAAGDGMGWDGMGWDAGAKLPEDTAPSPAGGAAGLHASLRDLAVSLF